MYLYRLTSIPITWHIHNKDAVTDVSLFKLPKPFRFNSKPKLQLGQIGCVANTHRLILVNLLETSQLTPPEYHGFDTGKSKGKDVFASLP